MSASLPILIYLLYRFEEYLYISPLLYPLNCLKAVSPEIKALKEHLCEVRAKLLEVIDLLTIFYNNYSL